MKALVYNGPRDIRFESFDDPVLTTPNSAIVAGKDCRTRGDDLYIQYRENARGGQ